MRPRRHRWESGYQYSGVLPDREGVPGRGFSRNILAQLLRPATFKAQFPVRSNAQPHERIIGGWPGDSRWSLQDGPSMSWYAMDCALKDVIELLNPKRSSAKHPRFDTFLAFLILHTMEFERKLAV
ncbi:hypothetical protein [Pseudomonas sp. O39]|uniref:hypothetical protein n=1 Tax=Pseudomonas sp. O39 TaxID=3379130 RepID=UPI00387B7379